MSCAKCNAEYSGEQCPKCEPPPEPPVTPPEEKGVQEESTVGQQGDDQTPAEDGKEHLPPDDPKIKVKTPDAEKKRSVQPFSANFDQSKLRDFFAATGMNNSVIGKAVYNLRPSDRPSTLFDHLEELASPQTTGASSDSFEDSELSTALQTLETERLLLIVCSDRDVARRAVDTLLPRVKTTTRRILSFNGLPPDLTVDVHGLTRRTARKSELLVLVDAYEGDRAQMFVDSLFAEGAFGKHSICIGLRRVRVRVACIANEDNLAGRITRLEFGHWVVSSARLLLRRHFPKTSAVLEARIAEQRRAGNWPRAPIDFRKQLEDLIRAGELEQVIEKGGPLAVTTVAAPQEQAPIADGENALSIAVLYTATFYPNLSPTEFASVVELVVGEKRTLVPETVQQKTKDGTFKMVELKREKRIAEIWNERTDSVLRDCRLITSHEAGRVITFADVGRRDLLRRHLDERYGAYVQRQFLMAWEKGLLFEKSTRIAAAVVSLTVDMALIDPEQFDREWLAERIVHFCEDGREPQFVLRRASDLLRTMLRHPPLDTLVNGVVQRLLQQGKHTYALAVVKALRLAPEFDELYWLQQILDRGTAEIRGDVLIYLFNELRRADIGIHRHVAALAEKWLPARDRAPDTYSHSNSAALLTVFAYCFEVTDGFDANLYGAWPSRFPIFAADRATAAGQFAALFRCLFHPGLITVLGEAWEPVELAHELALLISRWVFILYGVSDQAADAEDDTYDFTRDDALAVLVQQLLAVTKGNDGRVKRALTDVWELAKEIYLRAPSQYGEEGRRRRHEFGRMRRLVHDLITEFRRQQRTEQREAPAQQATA